MTLSRQRWLVPAIVVVAMGCDRPGAQSREARTATMSMTTDGTAESPTGTEAGALPSDDLTGTVAVDGRPLSAVEVALVAADGTTLAVARSDANGRFTMPAGVHAPDGWVVAKLHDPIVGAVAAPATGAIALNASSADAVMIVVAIELPKKAAPVAWFDVGVTPTRIEGIDERALSTLTLTGTGPARAGVYHQVRVDAARAEVRVLRGSYRLQVTHIVERAPTPTAPPPNWTSRTATLANGTALAARLDSFAIEANADVAVRVQMAETAD